MSIELMQKVSDNYNVAVVAHRELSIVFSFIGMKGYSLWHTYQHLDEDLTQLKVKDYISVTYFTYMPDKLPANADIAEPLLSGKNRKKLTMDDCWLITKSAFKAYQEWEEKTLNKFQQVARELANTGDIAAFNFVGLLIKDVKIELDYLNNKIVELSAMNYDMGQIIGEQPDYIERYERLIHEMLGESNRYHHHNSSLDAISRASILEKHPN